MKSEILSCPRCGCPRHTGRCPYCDCYYVPTTSEYMRDADLMDVFSIPAAFVGGLIEGMSDKIEVCPRCGKMTMKNGVCRNCYYVK